MTNSGKAITNSAQSSNVIWLAALIVVFTGLMLYMVVSLGKDIDSHSIDSTIYHFEDQSRTLQLHDIASLDADEWTDITELNFGLTNAHQWMKVDLPRASHGSYLEIDYAMLDSIIIWVNAIEDDHLTLIEKYNLGDTLPFLQRPVIHDRFLVPIPKLDENLQLMLRVRSNGPVKSPLKIWTAQEYVAYTSSHRLFMGLFFGYMFAMGLINLFVFVTTRNQVYLAYAGYVFAFALLIASVHGLGFRFLWPNSPWLQERSTIIFAYMTMSFILVFSSKILNLKENGGTYARIFQFLTVFYIGATIASFVVPYSFMIKLLLLLFLFAIPIILLVSMSLAFRGSVIARYFSAAWGVLLLSGILASADNFHWVVLPIDSSYLLMIGATTETLLLALALAMNYSAQRVDARRAHMEAAENEKRTMEVQDEAYRLEQRAKEELEKEVQARTQEFEDALEQLSTINTELKGLSETDALTGLTNRYFFEQTLKSETARSRRERQVISLAVLDIDHFKQVNDTYGHQVGDDCLVAFAQVLQEQLKRPGDLVARIGGEEFVVLLPNTNLDGAKDFLEQCRVAVENLKVSSQGHTVNFTVSIGLCSKVIGSQDDSNKILAYADKLLYQAKESGRNCIKAGNF
ncbi:sensor domain-containing diguanylate cyclase [Brumicola blandensis]|uniref:diguanylate cyclase n=1 Tax=Brumicola blandensis TaxID=3075611 RepID=A0AAW8R0W3_9ALTE|nr:diguanylate cyclase [Alteromonas sp. W409]MDT0582379.1 diguanylate cyclase [Alteromonas sp. W409]